MDILIPVLTAIVVATGTYFAAKATGNASNKSAEVSSTGDAIEAAATVYKDAIAELRTSNGNLKTELEEEKKKTKELQGKYDVLSRDHEELKQQVEALRRLLPNNMDNPHRIN